MASVYVPEIVSRGLVPEDLGSYFKQQLKWARGVHEVILCRAPQTVSAVDVASTPLVPSP
jgi:cellulose synthase (UDP-forming)